MTDARVWVADRFRVDERPERRRSSAWSPTSTPCATASPASTCSTTACASCRARPPTRSPTRRSSRSRCCASAPGDGADDVAATLDALYDRLAHRRRRHRRRLRRSPNARAAVDAFRAARGIDAPLERVDGRACSWRKTRAAVAAAAPPSRRVAVEAAGPAPAPARAARRSRRPRPPITKDLSVVVVFYNMQREAARTLHSLSRAYQQGIDDLDYEVIVVENGSDARPAARRGVRAQLRPRVPLPRPRRRRDAVAGRRAQPRHRARRPAARSRS